MLKQLEEMSTHEYCAPDRLEHRVVRERPVASHQSLSRVKPCHPSRTPSHYITISCPGSLPWKPAMPTKPTAGGPSSRREQRTEALLQGCPAPRSHQENQDQSATVAMDSRCQVSGQTLTYTHSTQSQCPVAPAAPPGSVSTVRRPVFSGGASEVRVMGAAHVRCLWQPWGARIRVRVPGPACACTHVSHQPVLV